MINIIRRIFITLYFILLATVVFSQNNLIHAGTDWPDSVSVENANYTEKTSQIMACAANTIVTTGYPAWTNYYAGYMFKVNNVSSCTITVNCFEARFQGTSGYRIYTKTGTFIGFEATPAAWTLVGSIASGLTGISTVGPTPIPIVVSVSIPPGASQSFYLTRTDNLVANRHLYITGTGTAGTTIYASDANVQITEAEYLDVYFLLQVGVRRPSFGMYYDKICAVLPIELVSFNGTHQEIGNVIKWSTATELNNKYFDLERSTDAVNWMPIATIDGAGTSLTTKSYSYTDNTYAPGNNYYRLKQVDIDGKFKYSNLIVISSINKSRKLMYCTNILGQQIFDNYSGVVFEFYDDGNVIKTIR